MLISLNTLILLIIAVLQIYDILKNGIPDAAGLFPNWYFLSLNRYLLPVLSFHSFGFFSKLCAFIAPLGGIQSTQYSPDPDDAHRHGK